MDKVFIILLVAICFGSTACSSEKQAKSLPPEVTGDEVPSALAKSEMKKLQGVWTAVEGNEDGRVLDSKRLDAYAINVEGNVISRPGWIIIAETHLSDAYYRLDPTRVPKHFDFIERSRTGDWKSYATRLGLYELDGDTLGLCWGRLPGNRPESIKSGDGLVRVVFHRKKSDRK